MKLTKLIIGLFLCLVFTSCITTKKVFNNTVIKPAPLKESNIEGIYSNIGIADNVGGNMFLSKGDTVSIWQILKNSKDFKVDRSIQKGDIIVQKKGDTLNFQLINEGILKDSLKFVIDEHLEMYKTKRKMKLIPLLFIYWDYDERILFIGNDNKGNLLLKQGTAHNFYCILGVNGKRYVDIISPRIK
jgi:hypothetical protein